MSQPSSLHPDRLVDRHDVRVLVGWTHTDLPNGINLCVQSTTSLVALENDQVSSRHLVMTRNQALLLSRYLLHATDQTLEEPGSTSIWQRLWRRVSR